MGQPALISAIIDPLATLLNVTGNNAATLLVNRMVEGEVVTALSS